MTSAASDWQDQLHVLYGWAIAFVWLLLFVTPTIAMCSTSSPTWRRALWVVWQIHGLHAACKCNSREGTGDRGDLWDPVHDPMSMQRWLSNFINLRVIIITKRPAIVWALFRPSIAWPRDKVQHNGSVLWDWDHVMFGDQWEGVHGQQVPECSARDFKYESLWSVRW